MNSGFFADRVRCHFCRKRGTSWHPIRWCGVFHCLPGTGCQSEVQPDDRHYQAAARGATLTPLMY